MLQKRMTISDLDKANDFVNRHIGPDEYDCAKMLQFLGFSNLEQLIDKVVPRDIVDEESLALPDGLSEREALEKLKALSVKNQVMRSMIGRGYYNTDTPAVILRNLLENPAWYTAYTPYQPEISQGRLEALLNFQTMVVDLTGMDLANASLLDEATAAAEAMSLCHRMTKQKDACFFVSKDCYPQTIEVLRTRADAAGVTLEVGDTRSITDEKDYFGILLQNPTDGGELIDYTDFISEMHQKGLFVVMAADLLSLVLVKSPGEMGADVVIGSSQRFGVPLGFGGPHAAYLAVRGSFKRAMPGRIVGVSVDSEGNPAYRLALQTREQHIRREKATSNICTAQVLLAVIASMYAVYHGPVGLKRIANRVSRLASVFARGIKKLGLSIAHDQFFDTVAVCTGEDTERIIAAALRRGTNLRQIDSSAVSVAFDETCGVQEITLLWEIFSENGVVVLNIEDIDSLITECIPAELQRQDEFLTHPVFNRYHSETEMMRYLRRLSDKDIALDRAMIPLGSCTMKLNAASEMIPISWPEFAQLHPFAPIEQAQGYLEVIKQLESMLAVITGYAGVSLQPNAGSQGEFSGLLAIKAYHESQAQGHRDVCLIPSSAHGTNPASAQMCNMRVVVVACDERGNVDIKDLKSKLAEHGEDLAAIMITYPSTHGVFEEDITEVCALVHQHGGQVYIDGANLNAMVGLCRPGLFGGDVSHLNLHKTFCIPHGGGGPGVGPVAVAEHLVPFLPGHESLQQTEYSPVGPVSAAAWGSAGILPISWMYITMMGGSGLRKATEIAILNANYIAAKLSPHFPVLYKGRDGLVAHECIIDLREIKEKTGISVDDVAKRLIDFGFHAPTMSFPVAGTLMIEPTESESLEELDRFCEAMVVIREEINNVENKEISDQDNPLTRAPHTAAMVVVEDWAHSYSRTQAAFPAKWVEEGKYWPPVGRIDNVYGDRNLQCSCLQIEQYEN